jgi:hypothetical protein
MDGGRVDVGVGVEIEVAQPFLARKPGRFDPAHGGPAIPIVALAAILASLPSRSPRTPTSSTPSRLRSHNPPWGIACPAAAFIAARLSLGFQLQPCSDSAARTRCQVGD